MEPILTIEQARKAFPGPLKRYTVCFLIRDGKIALGLKARKHGAGLWNGAGGREEEGDGGDIRITAIRETSEEFSAVPRDCREVAILHLYYPHTPEWNMACHVFLADDWAGNLAPSKEEITEIRWFPVDDLPEDAMWESDRLWLPQVLAGRTVHGSIVISEDGQPLDYSLLTGDW